MIDAFDKNCVQLNNNNNNNNNRCSDSLVQKMSQKSMFAAIIIRMVARYYVMQALKIISKHVIMNREKTVQCRFYEKGNSWLNTFGGDRI